MLSSYLPQLIGLQILLFWIFIAHQPSFGFDLPSPLPLFKVSNFQRLLNERFSAIHFQREKSCYFNETFVSLPHSLHHYLTPLIEHSGPKSDNDNSMFTYLKSFFIKGGLFSWRIFMFTKIEYNTIHHKNCKPCSSLFRYKNMRTTYRILDLTLKNFQRKSKQVLGFHSPTNVLSYIKNLFAQKTLQKVRAFFILRHQV